MLKRRLIGVILIKDGIAVQSVGFRKYLPIGRPEIVAEFLDRWGIDEIVALDISASRNNSAPNYDLVQTIARKALVPLAFGGGIKNRSHITRVLNSGADKVCLNLALWNEPELIRWGAEYCGAQAIIAAVDCVRSLNGACYARNYLSASEPVELEGFLQSVLKFGPGELFINSVDQDGTKAGFDIELLQFVQRHTTLPIIGCGGAGSPKHFLDVFSKTSISAAAAGNFFNFCEHSVNIVKAYLAAHNVDVRNDAYANYRDASFLDDGRVARMSDQTLEELRFIPIEEEKI